MAPEDMSHADMADYIRQLPESSRDEHLQEIAKYLDSIPDRMQRQYRNGYESGCSGSSW